VSLQTITAGSASVVNDGLSPASDISLGAVTTSGPQRYTSPNGSIFVTSGLTAHNHPIFFNNSVVLTPGAGIDAGSSKFHFVMGTVSTTPGVVLISGGAFLTHRSTFQAVLNGPNPVSGYSQLGVNGPVHLGGARLVLSVDFVPPLDSSF